MSLEIKELTKTLLDAFSAPDVLGLPNAIMASKGGFDKYVELVGGDLETDYLQHIFQYFEADRAGKKQDYTPASLGRLVGRWSADPEHSGQVIYDCCAGSGALSIQAWAENPNAVFIAEELDERVIPFLLFNYALRNINGYVINGDVLGQTIANSWRLRRGVRFSEIEECSVSLPEIDCAVSNPPFNIPWNPSGGLFDDRFQGKEPPASNANYAFILHALSKVKERAAFILPAGALSQSNEQHIREYLVSTGVLRSVIVLPPKMFESTDIGTCILLFDKSYTEPQITFIDAREIGAKKIREQRGTGGASHEARVYKKEMVVLSDETISEIMKAIALEENKPGFCATVGLEPVKANDFILAPSRYIEFADNFKPARSFDDIAKDINRCIRDKNVLQLTINETIARDTGLAVLCELMTRGNKMADDMNNMPVYKNLGIQIEKAKYIRLTKNKNEITFANISKECVSHILNMILPMYSQHIFYLNERENEYLAEMRDALLPKLMSGEISVGD
jgi:type I restriction-modification system DNA methylase subunit